MSFVYSERQEVLSRGLHSEGTLRDCPNGRTSMLLRPFALAMSQIPVENRDAMDVKVSPATTVYLTILPQAPVFMS